MAGQQAEHPDHTPAPPSLAEDAANFRCFIETIGDIVVIADRSGRLLYANPAAATTLGYSLDELRAMHMLDLHPAWVRQEAAEILADMFAGSRGSCPLPLIDRHGITIPVETRIWFGKWSGQDCVFGLVKDLTAEQEALQKFERLFRINPAPMAINSLNERRFVDVNAAFTSTLGYALEDVAGRTGAELGLFPDPLEQKDVLREFTYDIIHRDDLPPLYVPKMADKDGVMKYISGDIDWIHFSFLNGEPLDPQTAAKVYDVLSACCGLQHPETISWIKKGMTVFDTKAEQIGEYFTGIAGTVSKPLLEVSGDGQRAVRISEQFTRFAKDGRNHLVFFDGGIKSRLRSATADVENVLGILRNKFVIADGQYAPILWLANGERFLNSDQIGGRDWAVTDSEDSVLARQVSGGVIEQFDGVGWVRAAETTDMWKLTPTTTLSADVSAGATTLEIYDLPARWPDQYDGHVENWFEVGQTVIISPGETSQEIRSIAALGSLILDRPLDFDHSEGTPVAVLPANIREASQRVPVGGTISYSGPPANIIIEAYREKQSNQVLRLDGDGDYAVIDSLTDLSGPEITIQYWFKGVSFHSAVRQQNAGAGWTVAGWNGMHLLSNDGGVDGIPAGDNVTDGSWHHVTMTWKQNSPDGFASYLDGHLVTSRDSSNEPIPNHNAPLYFGAFNGTSEFANGSLDEIAVWSRALSRSEIESGWNRTLSGNEVGLLGYWPFDDGNVTDLTFRNSEGALVGDAFLSSDSNAFLRERVAWTEMDGSGVFHLGNFPPGDDYYFSAFVDANGNGRHDSDELVANYGNAPVTISGSFSGVDFTLADPDWVSTELRITQVTAITITLSWAVDERLVLQAAESLASPIQWTTVADDPVVLDGQAVMEYGLADETLFFRLLLVP